MYISSNASSRRDVFSFPPIWVQRRPRKRRLIVSGISVERQISRKARTHHRLRLVLQDPVDLFQDLWRELGDDVEGLQVVDDLLRLRGTEDDSARVRVRREPRQGEVRYRAAQLCVCPLSMTLSRAPSRSLPFSASSDRARTLESFFLPSSSFNKLSSVFLKKSLWFASREPSGMPLLYWCNASVSCRCRRQTKNVPHLPRQESTGKRRPYCGADLVFLVEGPVNHIMICPFARRCMKHARVLLLRTLSVEHAAET